MTNTNPQPIPERAREELAKVLSMADISYDLVGKLRARRYVSGTNYGELSDRIIDGLDAVGLVIRERATTARPEHNIHQAVRVEDGYYICACGERAPIPIAATPEAE